MWAVLDRIESHALRPQLRFHVKGEGEVVRLAVQTTRYPGLIGDHDQPVACTLQVAQCGDRARERRKVLDPVGVAALLDDHAVAIDEGALHAATGRGAALQTTYRPPRMRCTSSVVE